MEKCCRRLLQILGCLLNEGAQICVVTLGYAKGRTTNSLSLGRLMGTRMKRYLTSSGAYNFSKSFLLLIFIFHIIILIEECHYMQHRVSASLGPNSQREKPEYAPLCVVLWVPPLPLWSSVSVPKIPSFLPQGQVHFHWKRLSEPVRIQTGELLSLGSSTGRFFCTVLCRWM